MKSSEILLLDNPNERGVRGLSSTISPMNQIDTTHRTQTRQRHWTTTDLSSPRHVNLFRPNPPFHHTHVQHSC